MAFAARDTRCAPRRTRDPLIRFGLRSAGLAAALALSGCSLATPVNLVSPRTGYELVRSHAYGPEGRQTLDLYQPAAAGSAPVVVFFYGGSWQGGSKSSYRFLASALARRGFVVVVADYRVFPEVLYPGFVEDGAAAVAWARKNAARFGGDPSCLFLMGHSAGAHIAAMLVTDERFLSRQGLDPRRDIAGFVGLSGPYDFLPTRDPVLQKIFGGPSNPVTQPINFVKGSEPPALLLTGTRDKTVEPNNSLRFAERLRASGSPVEVKQYGGIGHVAIVGSIAWPLRFLAPVLRDSTAFIKSVAAARGCG